MSVAREGLLFIGIGLAAALGAVALAWRYATVPLWIAAGIMFVLAIWVIYFFRDPERTGQRGEQYVVSPADGKVVQITEVDEPAFVNGRALRISIFMNVFNVHVNRYPVSGKVGYVHYNAGKFLNAASDKASLENEQMSVGIESAHGRVLVRQIAGLIARRIVNYATVGDQAEQGTRMGIIRFGSRVDVFVPPTSRVRVRLGDFPIAGVTVLSEFAE
ncbi:MAG TPA: phosphatidylserine decarboxylase family protein [Gemmatimonadaceae bacterium]|nr:phosphatidylserine decarboxylase family protein [Gemmatimonadaceae bacterium]